MLGTVIMMESYVVSFGIFLIKSWVEGPTVTKDSETLGFSRLGTPNLQLVRFLCTIGC